MNLDKMEAKKNSKYYKDAYNNPSQYMETVLNWDEPLSQFQVDIIQGVRDATTDRQNKNYKYK